MEVLITIGIIGVVAAITIPVLMQNTNSKKFTTQFKKSLSTLNQAAINAQAQYDMNYSLLDDASSDSSCETDTLAANNKTMCGLFNNTLSGHTYQGVYGSIGGANSTGKYSYTTKSSIDPSGFLIYALADGSMIGFNPDARNCSLGVGNVLNSSMLAKTPTNSDATGLANCLGFIDVNGVNPPNREVTCADGTTELNPSSLCEIKSTGTSVGDVYPIVFHDGTVEPATNAAMSALLGGKSKSSNGTSDSTSSSTSSAPRTVNIDGVEYKYINGRWYQDDGNGNFVYDKNFNINYTKTEDGYEVVDGQTTFKYDNALNWIGVTYKGQWYDNKNGNLVRDDGNGNLVNTSGQTYTKTADGYEFKQWDGSIVKYDNALNWIGTTYKGQWYDNKNGHLVRDDGNGNLVTNYGSTFTKTSDGYEESDVTYTYKYDNNLSRLGVISKSDGLWYDDRKGMGYVRNDGSGNLVGPYGSTYIKRSDGLYESSNGSVYDENGIAVVEYMDW